MESVALGIDQTVFRDQTIVLAHTIFDVCSFGLGSSAFLSVRFQILGYLFVGLTLETHSVRTPHTVYVKLVFE